MRFATAALLSTALAVVPVFGDKPPVGSVTIDKIIYGGSGCPGGTVSENFNYDATAITLLFDSYIASAGDGIPITENRKNCQLNVKLNVPQGWSYTLATIDYRFFVQLDRGVTAQQKADYYFQGFTESASKITNFSNYNNGDYAYRDEFGLGNLIWSECNAKANMNINTQILLTAPTGKKGIITTDSYDFAVTHIYGIQWRKC
ncbi:hypothetical protein HK099_008269 [Clydaea vesicula]|uniref:DUF4360 domain-containing protein n=1 Tax=Clydaea vesicula TaxID=447962 RepID=A0AAD5XT59_9FUNG|nr:hypothetical protein HK099_008269 [Clydaea vesicula]KAJ3395616.1 hypothetical protein HDU92_005438 [Lobulomyces angularis]